MRVAYKISFIFFIFFIFYSCSPTKYIGKDEYLLDRVKVKVDDYKLNRSDLKRNIRQKPNTRILGVARFHLGLYNLSGRNEKKKFNQWLRRIGEAPVIYDPFMTQRSASQIELYLHNKGFYDAQVTDTVFYKKKKALVEYYVKVGPVTRIQEVKFDDRRGRENLIAEESGLMANFRRDTVNTLLEKDASLDLDVLDDERERITKMLRERGYFNFSKNFIQFFADTTSVAKENNRFMVGDIKQSIYRFRNARPDLFLEKMNTFETTDGAKNRLVFLTKNFRSRDVVLEATNDVFTDIMQEDFGGIAYDKEAMLYLGADFPETAKRHADNVTIFGISDKSDKETEAQVIAKTICEYVDPEDPMYVLGEDGEYRPAQYGDMAGLMGSALSPARGQFFRGCRLRFLL